MRMDGRVKCGRTDRRVKCGHEGISSGICIFHAEFMAGLPECRPIFPRLIQ